MRVQLAGINWSTQSSPPVAPSATASNRDIVNLDRIGGFVTKGLSRESMAGMRLTMIEPPPA